MKQVSHTDPLTGLRNRRALEADPPTGDYGLMLIDLDHFKRVNDTYGHLSGDIVLRQVSMAIQSCVRHGDRVFRVGGEEVLVVLPGDDDAALEKVAERTRVAIGAMDLAEHAPGGHVTLSIGTTAVRGGDSEAFDGRRAADRALYRAKQGGRDRVVHDPGGGPG
jgi:diguanylate cyclase (GGDEF)-like protein